MKEEQIEIEKDLKKLRESLQICKQELSKRQNELSQANQEEMDKKKEKTKILEKNKSEEDDLKKKLELAKKKLRSHHGEKDRYVLYVLMYQHFLMSIESKFMLDTIISTTLLSHLTISWFVLNENVKRKASIFYSYYSKKKKLNPFS